MPQVKIGPSFFAKEFNDYHNWVWAFVREAAQNSLDAPGTTALRFAVRTAPDGQTAVEFENDGEPMSEEVLLNKFLALGESGKQSGGSVGCFGKAKVILAFCHVSYSIQTGSLEVVGSGGDYELRRDAPYLDGTRTSVLVRGDLFSKFLHEIRLFAAFTQWSGTFTVNGEVLETDLRKGSRRRQFPFGTVYTNKSFENRMVVRVNGIPMFHEYVGVERCVVVELNGSYGYLASNRDALISPYNSRLAGFVTELSVDKRSALQNRDVTTYEHFAGYKLGYLDSPETAKPEVAWNVETLGTDGTVTSEVVHYQTAAKRSGPVSQDQANPDQAGSVAGGYPEGSVGAAMEGRGQLRTELDFVVKCTLGMKVPEYYLPGPGFSSYGRKLAKIWANLLVELHRLFRKDAVFSVGFIFSDECEAEHEVTDGFGQVYYLNPAVVVKQGNSEARSLAKRFKLTERGRLLSIALHEFVHGAGGNLSWHDENFSARLTELTGQVLDQKSRFASCFKV